MKKLMIAAIMVTFIGAGFTQSFAGEHPSENPSAKADHPDSEHPTAKAKGKATAKGLANKDSSEHPSAKGSEHPSSDHPQ